MVGRAAHRKSGPDDAKADRVSANGHRGRNTLGARDSMTRRHVDSPTRPRELRPPNSTQSLGLDFCLFTVSCWPSMPRRGFPTPSGLATVTSPLSAPPSAAMDTSDLPPSDTPTRPSCSCIRCADRKVKCDRQIPCGACIKHEAECIYDPTQPPRKRQRRHERELDALLGLAQGEAIKHSDPAEPDQSSMIRQRRSSQELDAIRQRYNALIREKGGASSTLLDTPNSEPHPVARREFVQTPASMDSEPSRRINKTQVVSGLGRSTFVDK